MRDGTVGAQVPIINVEGGCATGSMAWHGAVRDIWSRDHDLSCAVGVEKTFVPDDPAKIFAGGADRRHADERMACFHAAALEAGLELAPRPDRVFFLDAHALQAKHRRARRAPCSRTPAASWASAKPRAR